MSVNSSNDSFIDPQLLSNDPSIPSYFSCYISGTSSVIYSSFLITNICVLLPLCFFIFYHGLQQWQQKRTSSSGATLSHSDSFSYHLVSMEMIGLSGCAVCIYGIYRPDIKLLAVGNFSFALTWFGEMLFNVLTCLERYLAVVHPITYRNLRTERGIRIRHLVIACVWLFCIIAMNLSTSSVFPVFGICILVLSLTVVIFCSLSVLSVLLHPGPGEQGRGRERVDQSKQKAFNVIAVILGVLVVKFTSNIMWLSVYLSEGTESCLIMTSITWFNLPCSLVLPLLFVHRTGKLMCNKTRIKSERGLSEET